MGRASNNNNEEFPSISHQVQSLAGSVTSWGRKRRRSDLENNNVARWRALAGSVTSWGRKRRRSDLENNNVARSRARMRLQNNTNEAFKPRTPQLLPLNPANNHLFVDKKEPQEACKVYHRRSRENVVPFFQNVRTKNFNFMCLALKCSKSTNKQVKGSHKLTRKKVTVLALGKPRSLGCKNQRRSTTNNKKNARLERPNLMFKVQLQARIDLDKDTMREWGRLLEKPENEENEDTEAAEKYKEKWEKERELFRWRIASFISRMHLIQGNRGFSPWKGSVVDSVAGVFLAQNVSDILSSSAFMSLTARYPHSDIRGKSSPESSNDKGIERFSRSTLTEDGAVQETTEGSHLIDKKKIKLIKSTDTKKKKVKAKGLRADFLTRKTDKKGNGAINRDDIRNSRAYFEHETRTDTTFDAIDWHAVRSADVNEVSKAIAVRGMDKKLAERIKNFLNLLHKENGSIDLEWLRNVPPEKAKEYLLSIFGLGLKSVECIGLLTLQHQAFPVDTNVGRILVRLGWVPIRPLPKGQPMHLLKKYPHVNSIHKYLWPRLCTLDYSTLYEFHNQMITFGKVFCTKDSPNCNACPMRGECRHFASAFTSARLTLPADSSCNAERALVALPPEECGYCEHDFGVYPILDCIEPTERDMEDLCLGEIPTIEFDNNTFMETLLSYREESGIIDMSKALVVATPEAASIPLPKWKNISRLRTEHQVYELPDSHPLLIGLDKREPGDPCPYLLAIRTPVDFCNNDIDILEEDTKTIQGTFLVIPCRTATKGRFPLNGTFFQVNEVLADYESSKHPIDVPREWIWNLRIKTLFCGTAIKTIFRGMSTEDVQRCFWKGYVCLRGFNRKTRQPVSLPPELHLPVSKAATNTSKMAKMNLKKERKKGKQ